MVSVKKKKNEIFLFFCYNAKLIKEESLKFKNLVHGFSPKLAIFPTFFFQANKPGKCVL